MRLRRRLGLAAAAAVAGLAATLAGCTGDLDPSADADAAPTSPDPASEIASPPEPEIEAEVASNIERSAGGVPVDTTVTVSATGGTLQRVRVVGGPDNIRLPGRLSADGSRWIAGELLEPGSSYRIDARAVDEAGESARHRQRFHTEKLKLDQQTYPSVAPLEGETVGVGMPVVVLFDIPVTNKASIERHLSVSSAPEMRGTWHWYSDTEVHFRPRRYWPAGTEVTVDLDINGVDAGNGVYGQLDRTISFDVGRSVVSKVNVKRHRMRVFIDGELARTIPVTTGKADFQTRGGTKVIIEKFRYKDMDAATTGIEPGDPEYYNIQNVPYAMRVTFSGEFVHGAPWSEGSQGSANVSHGCVGMGVADARWLFRQTRRGDIVQVVGSKRELEQGNGWTDWDLSFAEYGEGSALS